VTAAIDGITRDGHGRRVASNVEALRALARQRVTLTRDTTDDADGATADSAAVDGDGVSDESATLRPAPSTARPEVVVVTDVRFLAPDADLLGSGSARLLWRQDRPAPRLTPHAVRRLSCDATIRPVLVDGDRILGTAEPYAAISKAIRTALAARDGACRFPACHAPVEVCDAHHLFHRADGGPTTLPNLALLCCAHHRAVHEGGWHATLDVTTGAMTFTRRGVTLHSEPRLPHAPTGTVTTGTPPTGRPRRRPPGRSGRVDDHPA
jgi:hypothetical protein